jgi:membrane protease YdiL (CAAX protease family)
MKRTRSRRGTDGYLEASKQPLHILLFLLPLVIAYEAGLVWTLRSEHGVLTIKVHKMLLQMFDALGINIAGGLSVPGILLVVVLLVWHILTRAPWKADFKVVGTMALETIAWTVPLLVAMQVIARIPLLSVGDHPEAMLGSLGVIQKILVSIGAGLYEEMVFRMLFIAVIHAILVDVGRASHQVGAGIAIAVSAACFAYYHFAGGVVDEPARRVIFYSIAGVYFGVLYVTRGFGIAAAVHALYDVFTLLLLPSSPT